MHKIINSYDFCNVMTKYGFSEVGAEMLFEYLTGIEDEDFQIKFDPIAFRCDFTEYTARDLLDDYGHLIEKTGNHLRDLEEITQTLNDETLILHDEDLSVFIVENF